MTSKQQTYFTPKNYAINVDVKKKTQEDMNN